MRFLVVDSEPGERSKLYAAVQQLLPSAQPVHVASMGEAREEMLNRPVNGALLDLDGFGAEGLALAAELRTSQVPVVVVTERRDHAVAAFDIEVTDYVLKPIEQGRLARAIAKLRKAGGGGRSGDVVVFSDQSHCWPVPLDDVIMAESEGSYVTLHVQDRKPILLCRSLREIETLLGDKDFVRLNRSRIIRLKALRAIKRVGVGLSADIEGWGTVAFSRRQAQAFRQRYKV